MERDLRVVIEDDLLVGSLGGHVHRGILRRYRQGQAVEEECPPGERDHHQVAIGLAGGRFALINAHPGLPPERQGAVVAAVLAAEPGAAVAVCAQVGKDSASLLLAAPAPGMGPREMAAAAAIYLASWGWNEQPRLSILVDGVLHLVEPRFDGKDWQARVTVPAAPGAGGG